MISGDVFWAAADNTSLIYVNDAERVVMKGKSISYLITIPIISSASTRV
jgi:hypothetical protein